MINASLLQEQAGSSSSSVPPRTEQLFTSADKEVLDLVERGEEQLLREAASKAYRLKQHYNNRGRIELGMTELSHLHVRRSGVSVPSTSRSACSAHSETLACPRAHAPRRNRRSSTR